MGQGDARWHRAPVPEELLRSRPTLSEGSTRVVPGLLPALERRPRDLDPDPDPYLSLRALTSAEVETGSAGGGRAAVSKRWKGHCIHQIWIWTAGRRRLKGRKRPLGSTGH